MGRAGAKNAETWKELDKIKKRWWVEKEKWERREGKSEKEKEREEGRGGLLAWVHQFSGPEEIKPYWVELKSFVLIHVRFRFADPQSFLYLSVGCL